MEFHLDHKDVQSIAQSVVEGLYQKMQAQPVGAANKPLLKEQEAARLLNVNRHVLRDARYRDEINCIRIGRAVRYEPSEIEEFKQRNRNRNIGE
jgi:hypothetical protein